MPANSLVRLIGLAQRSTTEGIKMKIPCLATSPPEGSEVYVFGSALYTEAPKDLDLLIVYDDAICLPSFAYDRHSTFVNSVAAATGLRVHLTLLTTSVVVVNKKVAKIVQCGEKLERSHLVYVFAVPHLNRYLAYLRTRKYMIDIWRNSLYDNSVWEAAKHKNIVIRDVWKDIKHEAELGCENFDYGN